jgi:hypothetical protein
VRSFFISIPPWIECDLLPSLDFWLSNSASYNGLTSVSCAAAMIIGVITTNQMLLDAHETEGNEKGYRTERFILSGKELQQHAIDCCCEVICSFRSLDLEYSVFGWGATCWYQHGSIIGKFS